MPHRLMHSKGKLHENQIGIMQGRLTPSLGRGIQFFPFKEWNKEFIKAKKTGVSEIEFIFDLFFYRENPIWTKKGRNKIKQLIRVNGVKVNSICADYFMRRPFFRVSKKIYNSNLKILGKLIKYASEIGATLIEIPLVDNSSMRNMKEENLFTDAIIQILPLAEKYNIRIGFETDLPPKKFIKFIKRFNNPLVGANYDTGNSSSLGYDPQDELECFGKHIFNIHIKDRVYQGSTVELGTGDANFNKFFANLKKLNYGGSFILQAARRQDGNEEETIKDQMKFIQKWI